MRPYNDNQTLVWRLIDRGGRFTECFVRSTPRGAEVEVRADGSAVVTHRFDHYADAAAWAEDARRDFEH